MIRRSPRNTPTTSNNVPVGQNIGSNSASGDGSNTTRNLAPTPNSGPPNQNVVRNATNMDVPNLSSSNSPITSNNASTSRYAAKNPLHDNTVDPSNIDISQNNPSIVNTMPTLSQNSTVSAQSSTMSMRSDMPGGNMQGNLNSFNFTLTQDQFNQFMNNFNSKPETKTTFVNCSARFNGGRNATKVEDFIATILVYKEAQNVSDNLALTSFPLLLEGYASTWWQGVQNEAENFDMAIDLLRKAFSPPKPDWRIFAELSQDKQKPFESTDSFICRKRRLFSQLSEKLSENIMINMVFSQLNISIREKLSRDSVRSFQELLQKARDIEMFLEENKMPKPRQESFDKPANIKCSYCRKKNHTIDTCYKKIESDRRGNTKVQDNTINCYGCGAAGYFRANCPNCNNKNPNNSPEKLDFNSLHTTIVGRNVPTVAVNINGMEGEAYFDTAARTSVAGYKLFQKLKEKEVEFQRVAAEIVLADGIPREEIVYSTIVNIIIGKRIRKIRFICLPKAKGNRTLIGIDFLEQANIVLDLADRCWHFKDEPEKLFEFKMNKTSLVRSIPLTEANIKERDVVNDYLTWFEKNNNTSTSVSPKEPLDYSPAGINRIFKDSVPLDYSPHVDSNLFPPMKRRKSENIEHIEINTFDLTLKEEERVYLKDSEIESLENLLESVKDIFEDKTETVPHIEHFINTGTHTPISCAPYRLSPAMKDKLKIEIAEMLKKGIIEEGESPWAFPVVLIPKKTGEVRVCVDYRKLNAITITDKYPLPRMDDLLHAAKATSYMSTIDLKSGYWQIKMSEKDKNKTAFTTPFGIYIFKRMPFGLKNAPATFQRLIDKLRNSLPQVMILAYLDDIIVCSKTFPNHLNDLQLVFDKIRSFNMQLNREKSFFCRSEVKYLGHILTVRGLKPDPDKTSAILERPRPRNLKQVISFLQTCSWFRRFMPDFAEISKPLSQLTKKGAKFVWAEEQERSFNKLKSMLVSPPILQQIDERKPFNLKTDASDYALGAVLMQGEKENEHPIEYASRLLLPAERNYSTTEREALAVVWAVKKFRGYIEGSTIFVHTDHQPLKWLFSLKSPTGRLARWSLELQSYNIIFGYTPGKQNVIADTLSRPPCSNETHTDIRCECFSISIDFPKQGAAEIRTAQLEDTDIKNIIDSFEADDENVLRHTNRGYLLLDGVLYRYCSDQDSELGQLVVPKSMRENILKRFHDDPMAGHYGIDKTIHRIAQHYYWSGMRSQIAKYVKSCLECQRYKSTNLKPAGLLQTVASGQRFEVIAIDLVGPLPRTSRGNQWILVVEDICSRWVELFALKEATAENCSIIILNEIVLRYGVPRRIHTDNGPQFISAIMQQLTYCLNIWQTFTPVYHPEANPVERKNRDLKTQLAISVGNNHTSWDSKLPMIRFAMNTSKCESTGYSAAYLTFGRELRSPLEVHLDLRAIILSENFIPQITPHLLKMAEVLKNANESVEKIQDKNKSYVDSKRRPNIEFKIGDEVLVATHVLSNADKNITSKFVPKRDGPYMITGAKGSSCFTIASPDNLEVPIGTYHKSQIYPYQGKASKPIYPLRHRGRPTTKTSNSADTSQQNTTYKQISKDKQQNCNKDLNIKDTNTPAHHNSTGRTLRPRRPKDTS